MNNILWEVQAAEDTQYGEIGSMYERLSEFLKNKVISENYVAQSSCATKAEAGCGSNMNDADS